MPSTSDRNIYYRLRRRIKDIKGKQNVASVSWRQCKEKLKVKNDFLGFDRTAMHLKTQRGRVKEIDHNIKNENSVAAQAKRIGKRKQLSP